MKRLWILGFKYEDMINEMQIFLKLGRFSDVLVHL